MNVNLIEWEKMTDGGRGGGCEQIGNWLGSINIRARVCVDWRHTNVRPVLFFSSHFSLQLACNAFSIHRSWFGKINDNWMLFVVYLGWSYWLCFVLYNKSIDIWFRSSPFCIGCTHAGACGMAWTCATISFFFFFFEPKFAGQRLHWVDIVVCE